MYGPREYVCICSCLNTPQTLIIALAVCCSPLRHAYNVFCDVDTVVSTIHAYCSLQLPAFTVSAVSASSKTEPHPALLARPVSALSSPHGTAHQRFQASSAVSPGLPLARSICMPPFLGLPKSVASCNTLRPSK